MRSNATRMEIAVAFVLKNPGASMSMVAWHVLGRIIPDPSSLDEKRRQRYFKQARAVVERVIARGLVRHDDDGNLHPWDEKRKAYAEALERAMFAAPDVASKHVVHALAVAAWRAAGDENAARILEHLRDSPVLPSVVTSERKSESE